MDWQRTAMDRLVCDLDAYRGVVERIAGQVTWAARVESRAQTYTSVYQCPTKHEAQHWSAMPCGRQTLLVDCSPISASRKLWTICSSVNMLVFI